jgi:hypothetical protein
LRRVDIVGDGDYKNEKVRRSKQEREASESDGPEGIFATLVPPRAKKRKRVVPTNSPTAATYNRRDLGVSKEDPFASTVSRPSE